MRYSEGCSNTKRCVVGLCAYSLSELDITGKSSSFLRTKVPKCKSTRQGLTKRKLCYDGAK